MYPHEDAVVLSYFDSQITVKDVASLKPRCWLTDNIINFYVEYVEQTLLRPTNSALHDKVAVIGPSVVQMLKFFNTNEFSALDCLKLQSKRLILLPLNDAAINDHGKFSPIRLKGTTLPSCSTRYSINYVIILKIEKSAGVRNYFSFLCSS